MEFPELERITLNPMIMGGKPCIRGMRITVGTIVGLVASGASFEEILQIYPYWESADIRAAVAYAAWQSEEPRNAIADRLRLGTRGLAVLALGRNTSARQKHEPEWSSKRAPTVAGRGYFECLTKRQM
jgi:uncharacterized protein (DUF433 family)